MIRGVGGVLQMMLTNFAFCDNVKSISIVKLIPAIFWEEGSFLFGHFKG